MKPEMGRVEMIVLEMNKEVKKKKKKRKKKMS